MLLQRKTYLIAIGLSLAPLTMATLTNMGTDCPTCRSTKAIPFPIDQPNQNIGTVVQTINASLGKVPTAFMNGNAGAAVPSISSMASAMQTQAAAQAQQQNQALAAQYQGAAPLVAPQIAFPTANQYNDFYAKISSDWSSVKTVPPAANSFYSFPMYQMYAQPVQMPSPGQFIY